MATACVLVPCSLEAPFGAEDHWHWKAPDLVATIKHDFGSPKPSNVSCATQRFVQRHAMGRRLGELLSTLPLGLSKASRYDAQALKELGLRATTTSLRSTNGLLKLLQEHLTIKKDALIRKLEIVPLATVLRYHPRLLAVAQLLRRGQLLRIDNIVGVLLDFLTVKSDEVRPLLQALGPSEDETAARSTKRRKIPSAMCDEAWRRSQDEKARMWLYSLTQFTKKLWKVWKQLAYEQLRSQAPILEDIASPLHRSPLRVFMYETGETQAGARKRWLQALESYVKRLPEHAQQLKAMHAQALATRPPPKTLDLVRLDAWCRTGVWQHFFPEALELTTSAAMDLWDWHMQPFKGSSGWESLLYLRAVAEQERQKLRA